MRRDSRLSVALHVLLHIDEKEGAVSSETLGPKLGMNPVVLRRTMAGLRDAGIVRSEKGHGGGWSLARDLGAVTLGDVHDALGAPEAFSIGPRDESRANAARVCRAFGAFGFPALAKEVEAFSTPDRMVALGHKPLRIDVMTSISGVSFREAWKGRVHVVLGGHKVAFLGETALRKNKLASGRPKDLADLTLLDEGRRSKP